MKQKTNYVPEIDGLRAIAVLSVILFHLCPLALPGGFSGVDVFFVISGYVVSTSLARETQTNFLSFAAGFYARRIIRIYPALVVCLMLVGLLQTLLIPESWLSTSSRKTAISAYFGLSNFALIWFNDGYFSPRVEFNPFTHTWSLGVEEQFYLLFPIVFFIWLKWRERRDAVGILANSFLAVLLIISLYYSWVETASKPDHAYYLLPSRFWELACGAMLFKLHMQNKLFAYSAVASNVSIALGLIMVGLGFTFSDPKAFPFPWAMLSVVGALLVIAGVVVNDSGKKLFVSRVLHNAVMVYVGKISYSLYLWHWPVLVMLRWTIGLDKPLAMLGAIALTVLMSVFSYHVIEKPIRQSKFVISRPDWYVVSSGLAMIALCFVFSRMVFKAQPYLSLSVTKDRINWYPEGWPSDSNNTASNPKMFGSRRMFVLGDSHAGAYGTLLHKLTEDQGVKVQVYMEGGCSVANLLNPSNPKCSKFIQNAISDIEKMAAPGDIVFLASLRMNRLGDQWETFNESDVVSDQLSPDSSAKRQAAMHETDILITKFEKQSLIVVMDAPKPIFKSPAFRCSDWFNADNPVCTGGFTMKRTFLLEHRKPVMESKGILMKNHPNLVAWDTFPTLCPSDYCSAFDEKGPLFFDGDHLSAHGNRVLYPSFFSTLTSIWLPDSANLGAGFHFR
jgi:peptidoglycan/LPS O-acetylase OafA/YrhL